VDVVVLADGLEFERYAGRASNGLYSHLALPPRIVLWGAPERWEVRLGGPRWLEMPPTGKTSSVAQVELGLHLSTVRAGSASVLRHELTHHIAAAVYGRQPLWFSEGQAQFLESLELSQDGRTVTVGRINPIAWLDFVRIRSINMDDVLGWQTPGLRLPRGESLGLYGASWQLFQWLFTTRPEGLRCYQQRLAAATPPAQAWSACLADLEPKEVDQALWEFARRGTPRLVELPVRPVGVEVNFRPLGLAEVHLVRAQLALAGGAAGERPEMLTEARTEVEQALRADPACVGALRLQAPTLPPAARVEVGRRAVATHAEDGWAWLLLADALWDTGGAADERERAYRTAVRLLPESPLALARAARNLLSRRETSAALAWAEHAARLAPWNGEVVSVHALALGASGRCAEARSAADRARKALPARPGGVLDSLEAGLRRACPERAAPGAQPPAG
jgi:tetratricopeptide (TPR) repeat protein